MSDSQQVTVAEAAKLVGRNRQTLYRDYINTGKLSATIDATGKKSIAIAELIRVFGELTQPKAKPDLVTDTDAKRQTDTREETAELQAKLAVLQAENSALRDRLSDKEEHIADLRATVRLLEHKPTPQDKKSSGWWPFGKKS